MGITYHLKDRPLADSFVSAPLSTYYQISYIQLHIHLSLLTPSKFRHGTNQWFRGIPWHSQKKNIQEIVKEIYGDKTLTRMQMLAIIKMVTEGKLAVVDQRPLNGKTSIADIAAEMENGRWKGGGGLPGNLLGRICRFLT
jgi:hypothetical protein